MVVLYRVMSASLLEMNGFLEGREQNLFMRLIEVGLFWWVTLIVCICSYFQGKIKIKNKNFLHITKGLLSSTEWLRYFNLGEPRDLIF